MGHTVAGLSVYNGRYRRVLGQAINSKNKLSPKRFLLGTDPEQARQIDAKLEQLWAEVVAEHEQTLDWMERIGGRLADVDLVTGASHGMRREKLEHGPYWRAEALAVGRGRAGRGASCGGRAGG